jgi:hypothetical protein
MKRKSFNNTSIRSQKHVFLLPGRSPEYILGCLKTGTRVSFFPLDITDGCKVGSKRGSMDSASYNEKKYHKMKGQNFEGKAFLSTTYQLSDFF